MLLNVFSFWSIGPELGFNHHNLMWYEETRSFSRRIWNLNLIKLKVDLFIKFQMTFKYTLIKYIWSLATTYTFFHFYDNAKFLESQHRTHFISYTIRFIFKNYMDTLNVTFNMQVTVNYASKNFFMPRMWAEEKLCAKTSVKKKRFGNKKFRLYTHVHTKSEQSHNNKKNQQAAAQQHPFQ